MKCYSYLIIFCIGLSAVSANNTEILERVFNGKAVKRWEQRHLVILELQSTKGLISSICSGSIISSRYVLTAAHCYQEGYITIAKYYPKMLVIDTVHSDAMIVNPAHTHDEQYQYDIALIKMNWPIKFSGGVQAIALSLDLPRPGHEAVIAGYGESEKGHQLAPIQGTVEISECGYFHQVDLCSYSGSWPGSGDSGGPIVFKRKLVGVISASCEYKESTEICLGLYASIKKNIKWIKSIIE